MADLFYPQLKTGAIAHYPVRKGLLTRTVANILPGGDLLMYPDDLAQKTTWGWDYVGLTLDEVASLQNFFNTCDGPLRSFTFLDPVDNLLSASSNFRGVAWQLSSAVQISSDLPGALPNTAAVTVVNDGQAVQEILQTLAIPGNYAYCFSVYISSTTPSSVTLFRRSAHAEETTSFETGPNWRRLWTSGNLGDQSTGLSVGLKLSPGQQLSLSAAQLDAQPSSSPYRSGQETGGVYPNAHWSVDELNIRYVGPNSCALTVSIEA